MKSAEQPFRFSTAAYLTRIGNHKASRITELREGLKQCSDTSIFYHTFQSLERHHFLTEGFSSDFAQWILAACNQPQLAEQLAGLDIREYVSLADLRGDLVRVVSDYCDAYPDPATRRAFEPFFFCESVQVTVPLGGEVESLEEFRSVLEHLSNSSFHFHFIVSRLRLHLRTNDFSQWFSRCLGLEALAQRANRIDVYTNTLESARMRLLTLVDQELSS